MASVWPPCRSAWPPTWAGDGLFRLSIGLEAPEDIIRDLDLALSP